MVHGSGLYLIFASPSSCHAVSSSVLIHAAIASPDPACLILVHPLRVLLPVRIPVQQLPRCADEDLVSVPPKDLSMDRVRVFETHLDVWVTVNLVPAHAFG